MPTTPNKKPSRNQPKPLYRRKLFWLLAIPMVLAGGGFAASKYLDYQNTKAIAEERARFEQADREVQQVSEAIVVAIGQPIKAEESKSCTRPSAKFTDSPLSCSIYRNFFYGVTDADNANKLLQSILRNSDVNRLWQFQDIESSSNISTGKFEAIEEPVNSSNYARTTSYQLLSSKYQSIISSLGCSISGIFYPIAYPPFEGYETKSESPYVLSITAFCKDKAREEYYPMQ